MAKRSGGNSSGFGKSKPSGTTGKSAKSPSGSNFGNRGGKGGFSASGGDRWEGAAGDKGK